MSPIFSPSRPGLRDATLARKFALRQGLWIEDLRIPPGQECSNGSLILLAVVLWRTFALIWRDHNLSPRRERAGSQRVMKLLTTKTIRFSQIVEKCGQPNVFILWQKPAADRHFQTQLKNNRVMTVQKSEGGTDFGIIDFKERKGARYLVFPKSLKQFADRRVIGIDWTVVRE
jgi:hypothetical protein